MAKEYEIRADYNRETLIVYQAYSPEIANATLQAGRFVPPFSLQRMTWIKPSFLWLMHRSHWGQKSGQERILAIRITRSGWEKALSLAVLTSFHPSVFFSKKEWEEQMKTAQVHVQWDPERSLQNKAFPYRSIQIGLSRHIIQEYVEKWIVEIQDYTPLTQKISHLLHCGESDNAKKLLPPEKPYPIPQEISARLVPR
ncbi:MAG: DUF4291 domain-containing protein [Planctomycetota bacterium]